MKMLPVRPVSTRVVRCAATLAIAALLTPVAAGAQTAAPTCCTDLSTVLTKTMFHVQVAQLDVQVDSATAAKVQQAIGSATSASDALSDSIADAYMAASTANTTMSFLHSVSLSQFLGGQKSGLKNLVKAGLLTQSAADEVQKDTETQFAFLKDGGINKGDKLINIVHGDSVTTRFVAADGSQKVDFTRVGPERRVALIGDYFGPNADFRDGLIESAMESASKARGH